MGPEREKPHKKHVIQKNLTEKVILIKIARILVSMWLELDQYK